MNPYYPYTSLNRFGQATDPVSDVVVSCQEAKNKTYWLGLSHGAVGGLVIGGVLGYLLLKKR